MSKIIIFLPVFIALVEKIFSKGTPLFISNFQMSHPIIYMIISLIIIIAYIVLLSSLFNIEIESHNKYLYIILIPIVFYLISSLLNIKPPSFIINFADSHTVIFSILVGIITVFYLLLIIIAAFMVIINKDYYPSSIIIFALIPSAAIVLLYIFNIGIPTFILLIINNILIPIKLRRIDVKLYKDNNNIGYGNNIFFQTLNFKKCNTLELDLTVYYNEAFKSMIPYLTKTFYGKAHAYVSFRFSFIPITFRIKIIKNI